jgi:hypothetical protein
VFIEDYEGRDAQRSLSLVFCTSIWGEIHSTPELDMKNEVVDLARRVGKTKEFHMAPKFFF